MKALIILLGMAVLVSVGGYFYLDAKSTVEVIKEEVINTVNEEDKYGNLDKMIQDAQKEAEGEINSKLEAYKEELLKEVEDEVKANYIKELEGTITSEAY